MDLFNDILKQASSNTKNASKEIKKIDEARQKIEKSTNVRLAMERKQSKIVKPPPDKPKVLEFILHLSTCFPVFNFSYIFFRTEWCLEIEWNSSYEVFFFLV